MTDLHYLTAAEALRLFRARELSPVELVTAVIERAEAVEPVINAFAETRYGHALDQAREAEARYAGRGGQPRPLDGLPVAVKEEAEIAGQRNTLGSLPLRDVVAEQRAARIHFGMIFGPSIRDIYAKHSGELASYTRNFIAESDQVSKDDFVAGLGLENHIYAPLGQLLEDFDALVCPTFAVPALTAEYDPGQPVAVNGQDSTDWLDLLMTLPFNIASRCPVLSVPSGLSRDGVPTGLSIVGKTYDDVTVFRIAAAHEERMPWLDAPQRRPGL